jgi:hypothetical protein
MPAGGHRPAGREGVEMIAMRHLKPLRRLTLGAMSVLALPAAAFAQAEWLNPTLGQAMFRGDVRGTYYPDERVKGQGTKLGIVETRLSLTGPLWQTPTDELSFSASARLQDLDTDAVLPATDVRLPGELWEIRFGPTYRHKFDNGWIGGVNLSVGSSSDQPFASLDEITVRGTAFLRVPHAERNAWLFTLNYTNYSDFLGGVPVPGVNYVYSPSDRFTLVVGFPFNSMQWQPTDKLSVQLTYLPVRTVRARVTYQLFQPLRVYAGFDWDNDWYLRAGRHVKDHRLFYYEKRLTGGVRFDLRHVGVEVSGGYAFDRFYFEGDSYRDRNENRIDVDAGPFVVGRVMVRF